MADLQMTWLGHGGMLYRWGETWLWVDRWTGAPTYPDAYRSVERADVVAPTHGHFDHVGDNCDDLVELAATDGSTVVCSHEMSILLASRGVEAIGMNKGGTVEAAGVRLTMLHADHSGGVTITGGEADLTREIGAWGWILAFPNGPTVYHSGDTDLFGDMALIRERFAPQIAVLPIGGHYTMGPRDAARALELLGVQTVVPVHYGTFPVLSGTPDELRRHTAVAVLAPEPGGTVTA